MFGYIWFWIADHATVLAAVVSAVSTIVIAWFTVSLVQASNKQGYQTEEALVANRRPFIFVEDFRQLYDLAPEIEQPADPNEPRKAVGWQFRPIFVNSGESPTRSLVTHVDYEFRDRVMPDNFSFADNTAFVAKMLVGPKSKNVGGSPHTFTIDDLERVRDGKMYLYLWGWVRYEGLAGSTKKYLTRYCLQVLVGGNPSKVGCPFTFSFPNVGNCSDDECALIGLP